jgi:hypothetical protein
LYITCQISRLLLATNCDSILTSAWQKEFANCLHLGFAADSNFDSPRWTKGLGADVGSMQLEDGSIIGGYQWGQESAGIDVYDCSS